MPCLGLDLWVPGVVESHSLQGKIRELRQLQALIDEATAEAEAIKDTIKAQMGDAEELRAGEYKISNVPIAFLPWDDFCFL